MFFRRQESRRDTTYKHRQLCAQVAMLVAEALVELDDPWLAQLQVVAADPAPDAGRLLITVALPGGSGGVIRAGADAEAPSADELIGRLRRRKGQLRSDVAAGITRKRAPELAFVLGTIEEVWP